MNGQAIAGTKSDEIQVDCETIEIASATDQGWTHHISGRKSWSLTVGWLVLANTDVRKALLVGSSVTIKIKGRERAPRLGDHQQGKNHRNQGKFGHWLFRFCR